MIQPNDWLGLAQAFVAGQENLAESSGDILVIFNVNDLAKCQRFASSNLFARSSTIQELCAKASDTGDHDARDSSEISSNTGDTDTSVAQDPSQVQYVLYVDHGSINTAPASAGDITCPFRGPLLRNAQSLLSWRYIIKSDSSTQRKEDPAVTIARLLGALSDEQPAGDHNIKIEGSEQQVGNAVRTVRKSTTGETLWATAYQICLGMIVSPDTPEWPDNAMALIDATVQVAQHLSALGAVQSPLNDTILDWTTNGYLWRRIHSRPDLWARIGLILKRKPVFVEAMTHLVGKGGYEQFIRDHLTPAATELARRKGQELRIKWQTFERKLFYLAPKKGAAAEAYRVRGTTPTDMHRHVYRIAHEWFTVHFRHLAVHGNITNTGPETELCDHGTADCYNYAGLIRVLTAKEPAYLSLSDMREKMRPGAKGHDMDKQLQKSLVQLKKRVAHYATPLGSTLKLDSNRKKDLRYLTCINFSPRDIPWLSPDDTTPVAQVHTNPATSSRLTGLLYDNLMSDSEPDESAEKDSDAESEDS